MYEQVTIDSHSNPRASAIRSRALLNRASASASASASAKASAAPRASAAPKASASQTASASPLASAIGSDAPTASAAPFASADPFASAQDPNEEDAKKPLPRGFAVLDAERRREIARLGGQTAHKNGNAHRFNPEEASLAGKKGGATVSENRGYMADIGRRGGLAKRGYKQRRAMEQGESDSQPASL